MEIKRKMTVEIERKFLVNGNCDYKTQSIGVSYIVQGYLCKNPAHTVRIRIRDDKGYITIKGVSSDDGTSRFEWEKAIDIEEARALLSLCQPTILEKKRHIVPCGKHIFEVDEFLGANRGLVLAEIELQTPDESFERPAWLGREVTGDAAYYNAALSHPTQTHCP